MNKAKTNTLKNRPFIGRKAELSRLKEQVQKGSAAFIVIKGRRRIGKSRLIEEFGKSFEAYYKLEGLAPLAGMTLETHLEEFSNQISRVFQAPKAQYHDFSDAFQAIGERVSRGKVLVFLDELSWMGTEDPAFLAKLKMVWDNLFSKNPKLVLVVCSSVSAWINQNLLSSTAFVGRISLTLTLDELSLGECSQFWPEGISAYEELKILGLTGGVPRYLEEINPKISAEENIRRLCFIEGGFFVHEFDRIFSDLFLRNSPFYEKIIRLLSSGSKEITEMQLLLCQGSDAQYIGRLPEYLSELEEAGFIRRDFTWNLKTGQDSKFSQFRLCDNYLRFYLKYIEPQRSKIRRGTYVMKSLASLNEWPVILGLQFENLVLNNRAFIHQALGVNPGDIVCENPFFQRKTARRAGCQVDYMIQAKFNNLYVCEIKFSVDPIGVSVIEEVKRKISALSLPQGYSYRPILIHVNGVTSGLEEADYFSEIVDMSQCF